MTAITPTVGRKVWFYTDAAQIEPIDATVIKVWAPEELATPDTCVNLDCVDPLSGEHFCMTSVQHSAEPADHPHFRWMPYQQKQAAKAN